MKIICIGLNYNDHNTEMGRSVSNAGDDPVIFLKPDSAILTDDKRRFFIPDFSNDIHYEVEVVVKISKMGKNIAERFAHRYYNEITLGIDFTARDLQSQLKAKGLPWEISKGFDNSAAVGVFVDKEELNAPVDNINFQLIKNGNVVQSGNTSDMIHPIDKIIAWASRFYTLKTGDLIFTGTPAGVGKVVVGDHLHGMLEGYDVLDVSIC